MADLTDAADAVVVGGGIAGIVTAYELLNHGKKVILLDRDVEDEFGGLARWSFGGMFFVDSKQQRRAGIRDSVDLALRDWHSVAHFGPDDHWPRRWAEQYVHTCTEHVQRWLVEHGITYFPIVHWVERGHYGPGNTFPRFHMVWGTGWELANVMIGHLRSHPKASTHLQLHFQHRVDEILTDANGVIGVRGVTEDTGQDFEVRGETTVIAAGGMGGNIDRVKENWYRPWGDPPETILNGAHQYADGRMHDAVSELNGHVTHLDKNWPYAAGVHHPRPRIPEHGLSLVPPKSALWMNYKGERIGPEPLITAFDTRFLVEQICKQEKKYSWQVLNMKIMTKEFAISGSESNAAIRDKNVVGFLKNVLLGNTELVEDMVQNCPDIVTASSIDELARKMNDLQGTDDVDAEAMKRDIRAYDAQIARGPKYHNDEQLRRIAHARQYRGDKVRTCNFQQIEDPKAMPLVAIREFILSRKTLGGIQTDLTGKVLTTPDTGGQQATIPGLYAVGECAGFGGGGVHGLGALEGTFLGGCVLTGRIAAHDIAGKTLI